MPNWKDVLDQIQQLRAQAALAAQQATQTGQQAVDLVRRSYLAQLHQHTGRNIIAYYSGFLSKPEIAGVELTDEDKNGFMMAVHKLDRSKGLDLILHTPGGDIAATESLVDYLRKMFGKNIRAIVPQIAMSAGAMVACSCREIIMTRHANLGPIDPHLHGRPAYGVIAEFKRALREIKKDPVSVAIWQPIISQYPPTYLSRCENAISWSNQFVKRQLKTVMFDGDPEASKKSESVVRKLTDYRGNRSHNRHIHFDECVRIGLRVSLAESDQALQDLVLTVHHCYMHTLMNTPAFKIVENHLGHALMKAQQQQIIQIPANVVPGT